MCSLIWAWINNWVNNREAGDLRCHRAHYDITVMGDINQYSLFTGLDRHNKMHDKVIYSFEMAFHHISKQYYTVYPEKYAHGFCFAVLCCGYTLTDFPISIRLTSLALWQSIDCPSASKATLMNMDKNFMWIHYERLHNHNKAKHNKTVCIFLGIYCIYKSNIKTWIIILEFISTFHNFEKDRKWKWCSTIKHLKFIKFIILFTSRTKMA